MVKLQFFIKKSCKNLEISKKVSTFAPQFRKLMSKEQNFGIWCNGNTTDSGPVILGSSPSIPTKFFWHAAGFKSR